MPQSLASAYLHLVFSTKERRPFLRDPGLRGNAFEFIAGASKKLDCPVLRVGGIEDHVHILARLGRTISIADWVKEVKRVSSQWIQKNGAQGFQWQSGYGVFSVSQSNVDEVTTYVERQEDHHRKMTFQDELRALLRRHHLNFDEQYLWD